MKWWLCLLLVVIGCGADTEGDPMRNFVLGPGRLSHVPSVLVAMMPIQSNGLGFNNSPALDARWTANHDGKCFWWGKDGLVWYAGAGPADVNGAPQNDWVPCAPYDQGGMRAPPDLGLVKLLRERGIRAASFRYGEGSTNIASSWNASNPGAIHLYPTAVAGLRQALAHPNMPIDRVPRIVFVTIIGETDAANATHSGNYGTNMLDIFAHLDVDFAAHRRQYIIVRLSSSCNRPVDNVALVRAGEAAAAAARSDVQLVETSDLPLLGDGLHRSPQNNMIIAERVNALIPAYL